MYLKQIIIFCTLLYINNARAAKRLHHFFRMKLRNDDGCRYKGYVPGGGVNEADVGRIKAPMAEIAKNGIMGVLGKATVAAGISKQAVGALTTFLGVLEDTSGKLGPALGLFGVATGIITSLNKVKPSDIINAVNEAIGQLTHDMNNKLEAMKGYVDTTVINLEKRLIKDSYEKYYIFWRNCMEEVNIEDMVECQREAYTSISSALPEFAIYDDELFKNKYVTPYKAREIEGFLVVFRDYANLVLMMLKPLVQTYENDKSAEGMKQYARYSRYMKEKTEFFIKYVKAAVVAIKQAHSSSPCAKTFSCGKQKAVWEGAVWFLPGVHTVDHRICTCTMDENTKLLCKVDMYVRTDTDTYWPLSKFKCGRQEFTCATEVYGKKIATESIPKYINRDVKVLTAYWQKNVLDFIPAWEKAFDVIKTSRGDEPLNDPSDETDERKRKREERPGAEERRKARLAKAEKELNMLHNNLNV